jgi:hypothetical protein
METEDLAKKESFANVEKLLGQGFSREQVFEKLGRTDDLARVIVSVPLREDRNTFKKKNEMLIGILAYIIVLKVITTTIGLLSLDFGWVMLPFAFFYIFVSVFLITQLRKYRGWAYSVVSALCAYLIFNNLELLFSDVAVKFKLITIIFMIPIAMGIVTGMQLKKALCPYLGYWGAKTDENGNYLFLKPHNKAL